MEHKRVVVETDGAPPAIGPYSQAIRYGDLLFCSGVLPLSKEGTEIPSDCRTQVDLCLGSLAAIAASVGTSLANALRLTIFTTRLDSFAEINEAYARWFEPEPPARITVGVAELPRDVAVEIEAVIAIPA